MRIEFTSEKGWKYACERLALTNIDYSTGTIENMFIIIHNPASLNKLCGAMYV